MFSERTGEVQNTFQHSKLSQQVGPVPLHPILRVVNYMEYGARTMKGAKVNGVFGLTDKHTLFIHGNNEINTAYGVGT